jgi:hypothetical protein
LNAACKIFKYDLNCLSLEENEIEEEISNLENEDILYNEFQNLHFQSQESSQDLSESENDNNKPMENNKKHKK